MILLKPKAIFSLILAILLMACNETKSPSNVKASGEETTLKTTVLEKGAALLQGKDPLEALNVYMNGFHFPNGELTVQMEAHHYCSVINEEMNQCIIYDGNNKEAKLIGIEYIISQKLFETLSHEEKKLWHSHAYEVKSGQLIAPGLPQLAEYEFMKKIVNTYGKTWHTWHTHRQDSLPVGPPLLMMGFTGEDQADPVFIESRDKRFNISSEEKRKEREDIAATSVSPGADAWEKGEIFQLKLEATK